jgi:hypothetical protein
MDVDRLPGRPRRADHRREGAGRRAAADHRWELNGLDYRYRDVHDGRVNWQLAPELRGPSDEERVLMPTFDELAADNPNIRQQYDEWREQRAAAGEDPTDYNAFRDHLMAIGAPDPGAEEIADFVGDDFKAAHPERYGTSSA